MKEIPAASPRTAMALVAVSLSAGAALQTFLPLNHDVAANLDVSRRLLEGEIPYRDIIEVTPPLVHWIGVLPILLSDVLGIGDIAGFRIFAFALLAASFGMALRLANGLAPEARRTALAAISILALHVAFWRPASFGQREFLALHLLLPYLLVRNGGTAGLGCRIAAALAAAVGGMIKPQFVLVPLAVETALLVEQRNLRAILCTETIILGLAGAALALAVPLFAPDYLERLVPLALEAYATLDDGRLFRFRPIDAGLLPAAMAGAMLLLRDPATRRLGSVLLGAMCGGFAVIFAGPTGFDYHRMIYEPLAAALAFHALLEIGRRRFSAPAEARVLIGGFAVLLLIWFGPAFIMEFDRERLYLAAASEVSAELDRVAPGSRTITSLSIGISVHPFALYAGKRHVGSYPCLWTLAHPLDVLARPHTDAETERARQLIDETRVKVAQDLVKRRPDIVMVDTSTTHLFMKSRIELLPLFLEEPRFAAAFAGYEKRVSDGRFDFYIRRDLVR